MIFNLNQNLISGLAKKYGLKFIILHGSYATGKQRLDSDVDIAVVGKHDVPFGQILKLHGDMGEVLELPLSVDLDLKSLNKVDPLFRYEVTRDGKLLFGNAADYEDFKAFSLRAYEDARPLLDLEHHLARKFQVYLNSLYAQ